MKSHISGMLEVVLLKFGMWTTEDEGHFHSKNRLRQHGVKMAFFPVIPGVVCADFLGHMTYVLSCVLYYN